MGDVRTDLMRGTLDLLILRSLMTGPLHGLGIARCIGQLTRGSSDVKAGSLFAVSSPPSGASPTRGAVPSSIN